MYTWHSLLSHFLLPIKLGSLATPKKSNKITFEIIHDNKG